MFHSPIGPDDGFNPHPGRSRVLSGGTDVVTNNYGNHAQHDAFGIRCKEAEGIKIAPIPAPQYIRTWRQRLREEVCSASGNPDEAFKWIVRVEDRDATFDEFGNSGGFVTLDTKLAAALSRGLPGDLARKVEHAKEKLTMERRMLLKGRQILFMV